MTPISSTEVSQLRRNAKRLARSQDITYSQALDNEAQGKGYGNWSQLMKQREATPASLPAPSISVASRAKMRQMLGLPRMDATRDEHRAIMSIVQRYANLVGDHVSVNPLSLMMDIEACHCNGCPIDLVALLNAERDTDLVHDVSGIERHMNRDTGQLDEGFTPRYSVASLAMAG
jgi:hypothetical protein